MPGKVYSLALGKWLYSPQDKAVHWAAQWSRIWRKEEHNRKNMYKAIHQATTNSQGVEWPTLVAQDIIGAIKLLKNDTALGVDFLDVWWLKNLSNQIADDFAEVLNSVERLGAWPIQSRMNIIVLMGKPAGGLRPIALMPMLYRIWSKARRQHLIVWEKENQGPWDAAVRGNSALRAAIIGTFFDEVASYRNDNIATVL